MSFTIRPLRTGEAALYRDIRLEALRTHPDALAAPYEHEAAQPLGFFAGRLRDSTVFGGFRGLALLGVAGFMVRSGVRRAHIGTLWGMYVRAEARGTGLSRLLVEAVLDHARDHVEVVRLTVTANNTVAHRLYAAAGFEPYGVERHALKVDGRYLDEVLMVNWLTRNA